MQSDKIPIELVLRNETYALIGLCMDVHRTLGHGFLEIVYKDAIENELLNRGISFGREIQYSIEYKGVILSHKFFADLLS